MLIDMHHRTDVYAAYKIVKSKHIWSKDGYEQANFHTERYGGGSDCKNEITLNFQWRGAYIDTTPDKWPGSVNTLYRSPWAGAPESLWALILFPGTNKGLELVGYSNVDIPDDDEKEHKKHLLGLIDGMLGEKVYVSVPYKHERATLTIPQLKPSSFWAKIFG